MEIMDRLTKGPGVALDFFGIGKTRKAAWMPVAVLGLFLNGVGWVMVAPSAGYAGPSEPKGTMTLARFEERQRQLHDQKAADSGNAFAKDQVRSLAGMGVEDGRGLDSKEALGAVLAQNKAAQSNQEPELQHFDSKRIRAANDALERSDYDAAEALFNVIRIDPRAQLHAVAQAEFGLGKIAEAQMNGIGAASHYRRAAELNPSIESLYKAAALTKETGEYTTALSLSIRHLALAETGTAFQHTRALNLQATLLKLVGRYKEAEPLYRQALKIDQATIGEQHPDYAVHLNNLALLLQSMGHYDEAEPLFRQALKIAQATIGEQHPNYAIRLNNLALLLHSMGRYEEAEPLLRQALKTTQATLGKQHPDYGTRLNGLAMVLLSMGRYKEAEPLFRQALKITQATLGEQHPRYGIGHNNLARLLQAMGRYDEAEPLYRKALEITQAALGEQHPSYAIRLGNLATLLQSMGRYDEAEPLYRQALKIDQATIGEQHPRYATDLGNLAVLFAAQGKWAEVEPLMVQALDIIKATLPADHPNIAQLEKNLATIREKLGKGN